MHVSWSQHTIHCEQAHSYLTGTKSMRYKRMYPGKLEMDKILFCWDKIPFLSFLLTAACFTEVLVFTTKCLSWWESSVKGKIILVHVCLYRIYQIHWCFLRLVTSLAARHFTSINSNIPALALTKVKLTWDNVLLMYFAQHPLKDQEMIHPCC